jgi:hypothetical protein
MLAETLLEATLVLAVAVAQGRLVPTVVAQMAALVVLD